MHPEFGPWTKAQMVCVCAVFFFQCFRGVDGVGEEGGGMGGEGQKRLGSNLGSTAQRQNGLDCPTSYHNCSSFMAKTGEADAF